MVLNNRFEGAYLYEVEYTPKGTNSKKTVSVWAKSDQSAANYLIFNHIWGTQHEVRLHSSNYLHMKEK